MDVAIIDVGGGMRDVFSAGLLDYLMDNEINIDHCIGVSAGASNLATYIAGQRGRVKRFYDTYPNRPEYMGFMQYLLHGSYLNLKYIYEEISFPGKEDPFDIDAYEASNKRFTIVATNANTGKPVYFPKDSVKRCEMRAIEASCTIPVLCRPTLIEGVPYFDGGVSDPIPYKKAFEEGAEKVIVLITKRRDDFRDPKHDERPSRILAKRFPNAAEALRLRAKTYNDSLREVLELEKEGKALLIAPDDTCGVTTTKHKRHDVEMLYQKGYESGELIIPFLS